MPVSKAQQKSPTRGVRAARQRRAFLMEDSAKVWPRGPTAEGTRALLGPRTRGSLSPRRRRTTKGRVCPSGAGRAGRGAAFVPRVLSETSAAAQRASLCPWGRPSPAGHRCGATERDSAGRTRGPSPEEARRPRLGGPCIRL